MLLQHPWGRYLCFRGQVRTPDLTISTDFDLWKDIITGKADGQQRFLEQRYTVKGDLELLMRMKELFGG